MSDVMALPSRTARKNHQYSVRVARPLKSAYFLKQVFTASTIGIRTPPVLDAETARNTFVIGSHGKPFLFVAWYSRYYRSGSREPRARVNPRFTLNLAEPN